MRVFHALCALLTCAALCAGNAAYAQPRQGFSDIQGLSDMRSDMLDEPGFKEIAGSNPCPRIRRQAPQDRRQLEFDETRTWVYAVGIGICVESVRSDAVALAWKQGLDEHGVPLDAEARASKLAEIEDWLRRLKGKFRIEGKHWDANRTNVRVRGTADCFGIGSGPGVSCLISADWMPDEDGGKEKDPDTVLVAAIRPQVLLFGLDPDAMEVRVTLVDATAIELHGFLQDGTVILNEQSPPEVFYIKTQKRTFRELFSAIVNDTVDRSTKYYLTSLRSIPPDSEGNLRRRLSRVAMTQGGEVDIKLHVFTPVVGPSAYGNPPIAFDLQLHREPQGDAVEPDSLPAAEFTCAQSAGSGNERLQDDPEMRPAGVKKESSTREMQAWLERLVGQYTVEGHVDLCGNGNPKDHRPVSGNVDCIAAGSPPSVHCKVNANWPPATGSNGVPVPGGVSNLAPAQFLFSLFTLERYMSLVPISQIPREPTGGDDTRGLHFLQLDNRGITEWASSELIGDTFVAREYCADIPGDCDKITRITARPGSDEVSMRVEVEIDRKRVLLRSFVLRRESKLPDGKATAGVP